MIDMLHRNRIPELMDDPELAEATHRGALRGLSRVNWISCTVSVLWRAIRRQTTDRNRLRVLDVGCGGGDVLIGLAQRACREDQQLVGIGCDISPTAIKHAEAAAFDDRIHLEFLQLDCLADPLPGAFDVAICSLFLHHLDDAEVVLLLGKLRESSRAIVVDDLVRSRVGFALAWLGTRIMTRSRIVHVDGPLSVRAAFSISEIKGLADEAGLRGATISRHWPFRFLLEWSPS
jgi:2-polyprenyl-3-methyl-5-hydroxy-6-metoxy-1,4-benzoquinol methylase